MVFLLKTGDTSVCSWLIALQLRNKNYLLRVIHTQSVEIGIIPLAKFQTTNFIIP